MEKPSSTLTLDLLPERIPERVLADFWSKSPRTLQRARCTGELQLPYLKIGRNILYRREDVLAYESQRRYLSTSQRLPGDKP